MRTPREMVGEECAPSKPTAYHCERDLSMPCWGIWCIIDSFRYDTVSFLRKSAEKDQDQSAEQMNQLLIWVQSAIAQGDDTYDLQVWKLIMIRNNRRWLTRKRRQNWWSSGRGLNHVLCCFYDKIKFMIAASKKYIQKIWFLEVTKIKNGK